MNYTWSKAIDDLPAGAGVEGTPVSAIPFWSPGRHQFEYGVSDFDHTHLFVASYNWKLAGFASSPGFAKTVLGNWEVSGVLTLQSGDAFTVQAGKDQSQTGLIRTARSRSARHAVLGHVETPLPASLT